MFRVNLKFATIDSIVDLHLSKVNSYSIFVPIFFFYIFSGSNEDRIIWVEVLKWKCYGLSIHSSIFLY